MTSSEPLFFLVGPCLSCDAVLACLTDGLIDVLAIGLSTGVLVLELLLVVVLVTVEIGVATVLPVEVV
jgi:hypothetical protein